MKTVHNLIILDASGSMSSIYNQALSGLNETIQTIQMAAKDNPEIRQVVTLASFNDNLHEVLRNTPAEKVRELTKEDYQPIGCTALYDAIGEMVYQVKGMMDEETRALVTIITDGYENASHKFSGKQIKSLIDELRAANWMFTYIGANQDVEAEALKMGIHSSLCYSSDEEGSRAMFAKERRSRSRFFDKLKGDFKLSSLACEEDYFEEDK